MLEYEVKILNVNTEEIQAKLDNLGAKRILDDVTYIEGYDFDSLSRITLTNIPQNFQKIVDRINELRGPSDMFSQGAYLRLRREERRFELIFKQKVKGSHQGVKSEIEISSPIRENEWENTAEMLTKLGLKKIVVQEKKRVSYTYPPFRYDMDTWPGVPTYLEVEAPSPKGVLQAIALLGFTKRDAVSVSAAEVFEMYGIDNPRHLVFHEKK